MLVALLRLMARLPLPVLHGLGRTIGRLIYAFPGRYRRRLQNHCRQAGYDSPAFFRQAAGETGAMIVETPRVWLHPQACLDRCTIDNLPMVQETLAEGRGILYLTPHLGCFEMIARYFSGVDPMTVLFRPPRQAFLEPLMVESRDLPGLHAVPANIKGVRELVRAFRRGESAGMLPDQVPSGGDGVWAPFFGRPALTMPLAGKLARQSNVPVIVTAAERLPKGRGWHIHTSRLPEPLPQDPTELATLINESMENLIRRFPTQYLWGYNRYKVPHDAPPLPGDTTP